MSTIARPPVVRLLGFVALGLFGLNFATWFHSHFGESERCTLPARAETVLHADEAPEVYVFHGTDHAAVAVEMERALSSERTALRVLATSEARRAVQAAGDHLDALPSDAALADLARMEAHLALRAADAARQATRLQATRVSVH